MCSDLPRVSDLEGEGHLDSAPVFTRFRIANNSLLDDNWSSFSVELLDLFEPTYDIIESLAVNCVDYS